MSAAWSPTTRLTVTVAVAASAAASPGRGRSRTVIAAAIVLTLAVITTTVLPRRRGAGGTALPRSKLAFAVTSMAATTTVRISTVLVPARAGLDALRSLPIANWASTGEFLHELLQELEGCVGCLGGRKTHLILAVDSVARADGTPGRGPTTTVPTWSVIAPVRTALTVWTISSHVTSIATDAADDVGGEIALLRTVVLAVSDLAALCDVSRARYPGFAEGEQGV